MASAQTSALIGAHKKAPVDSQIIAGPRLTAVYASGILFMVRSDEGAGILYLTYPNPAYMVDS